MSQNPPRTPGRGGGRGRGSNNNNNSGRTPIGGRGLVDPRTGRGAPSPVHQGSGVPFGHVPAYLPGSASLVEELDQRLLIVLRDGKHLIGVSVERAPHVHLASTRPQNVTDTTLNASS